VERQTIPVIPQELIKVRFCGRKDQAQHQTESVHRVKISPANVSSNRMLT
jgi:hypothetical protein